MKKALFAGLLIAALALIALGCDSGGGGGGGGNGSPYYGTSWEAADGSTLSFVSDTEWQMIASDGTATKGTYTYSGGSITLTTTHTSSNAGAAWTAIPPGSAPPIAISVSGDSLAVNGEVFGKQDDGGGGGSPGSDVPGGTPVGNTNPYYGTVWEGADGSTHSFISDTEWQLEYQGSEYAYKGTYTYEGSSMTFTFTHQSVDSGVTWTIPEGDVHTETVTVSDDAFTFVATTFVKQGRGADNQYYETVWEAADGTTLSFMSAAWQTFASTGASFKGTYTHSGSSITFTQTHVSYDSGANWTALPGMPETVTISGNTLVLGGIVFVMLDGNVTWTRSAGPFGSNAVLEIVYGAGRFIAVGYDGQMAHSVDGISWTAITSPFTATSPLTIAYGDGLFVVAGRSAPPTDTAKTAYSTDGIAWTLGTDISSFTPSAIEYGGGKFVMGGYDGRMFYSTDGQTWTAGAGTISLQIWFIAYGDGRFVGGTSVGFIYSDNGETWSRIDSGSDGPAALGIAYGRNKFVAISGMHNQGLYSADGLNWTATNHTPGYFNGVAYGGGKFVAVGGGKIAYSFDGIIWKTSPDYIVGSQDIAYGSGRFVFGDSNGDILYSNLQE